MPAPSLHVNTALPDHSRHLGHDLSPSTSRRRSPSRVASPSNPFQPIRPRRPTTATNSIRVAVSRLLDMLPPTFRRLFTSSPLVGLTILVLLCLALFFHRPIQDFVTPFRPWSTSTTTSPSSSHAPAVALEPLPPIPVIYEEVFPDGKLPSSLTTPEHHLLAERLVAFLSRPIESHDEATERMHENCPAEVSDKLVNPDQYNGDSGFWMNDVTKEEIVKRRLDVVRWLEERIEQGEKIIGSEGTGKGRGIVLTGGNQDTTFRTITVLKHLRSVGNHLPVEVFHYEGELQDHNQRREIEGLGATLRQAVGVEKQAGAWKNWQIKGLAIVQSSFREVLYLDSDNIPLRSPAHLFDAHLYTAHGAAFWPDLSKDHPDNAIWRLVGDTCDLSHWTFESGQIVIDKAGNAGLNLAALWIASGMMGDREFWFHMCGGDKDTFRWAFRILNIGWNDSPRWMSALGFKNGYDSGRFCGHTTLQYDLVTPEGHTQAPPLFVHSNLLKHLGGGLAQGQAFTHVKHFAEDNYSDPALNFAHLWVYHTPLRGMCLDMEWHPLAYERLSEEDRERHRIEEVKVDELEGKPFEGFEQAFFEEGGRVGGW